MTILHAVSQSEAQTEALGYQFGQTLTGGEFIAMYGALGAGKTAFVRGMAACIAPGAA